MAVMPNEEKPHVEVHEIDARFQATPADEVSNDQANWIETYRNRFSDLAVRVNMTIADSREKSLALTALEEAAMWVNKAILK